MKLPGFVKMGPTAIVIALLPLAVGCTGNDARKMVEEGTREAGDRIDGPHRIRETRAGDRPAERERPGIAWESVGSVAGREVFRRRE
ncbi:hypothetical protein [Embleya hyalina]|uniref:Lipoprotein n=1 Tax=Embleya hyalina TaxID=516124 RepID=A0A401YZ90_9ACTN|nr:hypothetical protein [Embleya hyalina]GCD99903.1 hypothetical protein EHYA_07627 [Embleya hyalina]